MAYIDWTRTKIIKVSESPKKYVINKNKIIPWRKVNRERFPSYNSLMEKDSWYDYRIWKIILSYNLPVKC